MVDWFGPLAGVWKVVKRNPKQTLIKQNPEQNPKRNHKRNAKRNQASSGRKHSKTRRGLVLLPSSRTALHVQVGQYQEKMNDWAAKYTTVRTKAEGDLNALGPNIEALKSETSPRNPRHLKIIEAAQKQCSWISSAPRREGSATKKNKERKKGLRG